MATIKTKHSNTASAAPTGLVTGELAVNTVDKKMWIGNGTTEVVLIGNKLSGIEAASATDGGFLVGDGTKFVVESLGTARTSLGLGALATENDVNLGTSEVTGTLTVDHGGTGATSFTSNGILKGAGSGALVASGVSIDSNNKLNLTTGGVAFSKYGTDPTSAFGTGTMFYSSTGALKFSPDGTSLRTLAFTTDLTTVNDGTLTLATSGTGLSGSASFTANDSDNVTFTVSSNATHNNTASTIVARDGSGNFSAGTITAALNGNADTATKWATPRTISLTGDVTGTSGNFDGSGNLSFATTIAANSVALGTDTTGNYVATIAGTANEITVSGSGSESAAVTIGLPDDVTITNDLTVSNDLTVTGNLTVNGTTTTVNTTNLNVTDTLVVLNQGLTAGNTSDIGFIFERGTTGDNAAIIWDESTDKFTLGTTTATGSVGGDITVTKGTLVADITGNVTGDLTGNADTATKWATPRTISLTGDVTGTSGNFDGSGNLSFATTIAANSVALGTDTTGNYVGTITAGTALSSTGATTGEGIAHTISLNHLGIEDLADPGADRILFWDETAGFTDWLIVGSNLTIDNKTINATNTTYTAGTGLTLSGTEFSISTSYVGQTSITTLGTVTTGTIDGGTF